MLKINDVYVDESVIKKFWSRVDIRGPDDCWEWTKGKNSNKPKFNYGIMYVHGDGFLTHRLAVMFTKQKWIPVEVKVCHKCDNPPCCNPNHLFEGSQLDNVKDMYAKKRNPRPKGERHYKAKLTDESVREIRKLYSLHLKYKNLNTKGLAKLFNVNSSLIARVVTKEVWAHVEDLNE